MSKRAKASSRRRLTAGGRRELIERAATELFATRGYRGASMDEIARRSGVTPPVVYDHFASKADLYRQLVDRHYAALRQIWFDHAAPDQRFAERIPLAIEAWFAYIEEHPFVAGLLFREPTDDAAIGVSHRTIRRRSRGRLLPLVAQEAQAADIDLGDVDTELVWETMRAVLQGLALWWHDHPDVPRARIVAAAMNALWLGLARVFSGERWAPAP